jgi:AraC-like DNA-binding protein
MFYQFHHLGSPDYLKVERGINFSFPLHLHQCFEIIVVREGEMHITVDGQAHTIGAGQAMLIFPNQIHDLRSNNCKHLLAIFSPRLVQAYASRMSDRIPQDNRFEPDAYIVEMLDALDHASPEARKGALYLLCSQFDRQAQYRERGTDSRRLLFRIFSFVEQSFAEDCTLNRLSQQVGYNYSYLSRYFRKAVGISFNDYVVHYRLSHACYLLDNTDGSIMQCALESGFDSIRSFNRNFKERFAITPVQYRKKTE